MRPAESAKGEAMQTRQLATEYEKTLAFAISSA
jgi:hypothetical protein